MKEKKRKAEEKLLAYVNARGFSARTIAEVSVESHCIPLDFKGQRLLRKARNLSLRLAEMQVKACE